MTVEFNTGVYRFNHGAEPRGYGSWMFAFEGRTFTAPTSTYGQAKKACAAEVRRVAPAGYVGHVDVQVLP